MPAKQNQQPIRSVLSGWINCYLPTICVVCSQNSAQKYSICENCEQSLPRATALCCHCGVTLEGRLTVDACCGRCLHNPPNFNFCKAAFPYVPPINKLVTSFKFSAKFDIGFALSKILARGINTYYRNKPMPQYLIPVPLHRKRQQLRGFNQALEISKVISADCSIPLLKSAVTKSKATLPQTEMASASARSSNLKGAFLLQQPQLIQNVTHIALIDDVVTTMATAETLAHLLQNHGIRRVDVWCIARANR